MQIGLIAQDSRSLDGIVLMIGGEFLQCVESLLVNQEALLNPAFDPGCGAHPGEALLALQNLHALSILHFADAVIDSGNLIPQRRLRGRNVSDLQDAVTTVPTGRKQQGPG